jgi:hypothetical protein
MMKKRGRGEAKADEKTVCRYGAIAAVCVSG